jgi:lipopolysaccharide export system permease protein
LLIFRYLARDLLSSTFAVCTVLLLVILSGRFVKYLAQAAAGELDAGILLAVIGYRLPGFLELILPLAFFLGILLAYGRFYVQNEMTVMIACGMSQARLVAYTMVPSILVALFVAWLSLDVGPTGLRKAEALLTAQKERGELDGMAGHHFYPLQGGKGVTYAEEVSEKGMMTDVFLAENNPEAEDGKQLVLVVAETGRQHKSDPSQPGYLILEKGYRIQGVPGQANYQITRFEEYGQRLSKPKKSGRRAKADTLPTEVLLKSDNKAHMAALHWRFSVPILVLVVTLIAIPLSKTNPRQGRFARMLPAVLLYVIYLVVLNAARGAVEDGKIPTALGLWWVHALFLFIALLLLLIPVVRQKVRQRAKQRTGQSKAVEVMT